MIGSEWIGTLGDALPFLLTGLPYTIGISVVGLILGYGIGVACGLASLSTPYLRYPALIYVELFRGTPVLVQVLFIYYGLPTFIGPINALVAAVICIGLNSGAYMSEVVRGAIISIDSGQKEAGLALGLTRQKVYTFVIWPQAFRRMIPPLGNQAIVSIKDTSLFSVIGVGELLRQAQIYSNATYQAFEVYALAALLYLAITLILSLMVRRLERKLAFPGRG